MEDFADYTFDESDFINKVYVDDESKTKIYIKQYGEYLEKVMRHTFSVTLKNIEKEMRDSLIDAGVPESEVNATFASKEYKIYVNKYVSEAYIAQWRHTYSALGILKHKNTNKVNDILGKLSHECGHFIKNNIKNVRIQNTLYSAVKAFLQDANGYAKGPIALESMHQLFGKTDLHKIIDAVQFGEKPWEGDAPLKMHPMPPVNAEKAAGKWQAKESKKEKYIPESKANPKPMSMHKPKDEKTQATDKPRNKEATSTSSPKPTVRLISVEKQGEYMNLSFEASHPSGIQEYHLYRNNKKVRTVNRNQVRDPVGGLAYPAWYEYKIKALSNDGTTSDFSNEIRKKYDIDNCFIATAAYGSLLEPDVVLFRRYRDSVLKRTMLGRSFISVYYSTSPPFARLIEKHDTTKKIIRFFLSYLAKAIKKHL
ncbi:hypothetical protein GC093_20835 [Paenibacillus sp. LMG 31456]|uniref:Fibronectin type-III domain-containing protein n=1 Tax=Paenibacillus foliorum TaxID=2654974 RepID=A0A972GZC1_9BACL|nr:CFI-box-CTERM domain-containing protein [Paenibacillus foliorum]NOU95655.1 hypothetical protein [Paenibacillus foliorum]